MVVELLVTHMAPSAMHVSSKQHPPPPQVWPAQQGAPGVPQVVQIPAVDDGEVIAGREQTVPEAQESAAFDVGQQVSPAWPQGVQVPVRHASPVAQVVPQQGCPEPPQLGQ